jgi:hypothetical protein
MNWELSRFFGTMRKRPHESLWRVRGRLFPPSEKSRNYGLDWFSEATTLNSRERSRETVSSVVGKSDERAKSNRAQAKVRRLEDLVATVLTIRLL